MRRVFELHEYSLNTSDIASILDKICCQIESLFVDLNYYARTLQVYFLHYSLRYVF